jgi:hypothetical protein
MKYQTALVLFLIITLSIGIAGYISSMQPAVAQLFRTGRLSICELNPSLCTIQPRVIGPVDVSICVRHPEICEPTVPPEKWIWPGPCLVCGIKLNESLILTPIDGSVIATKIPTASILSEGMLAQLNRTNGMGNTTGGR